ncbi:hypothetical protein [Oceanobacillus sp. FSL H7-0719]|uniref:hypothetical protein n=1 Tax=Oceanobacillus sp. FSL H7-0719 TaxID=2954507 RepID=UPI00324787FF
MKEKNGYSIIEVIIAASLFLSTVAIFVPILNQLQIEKNILRDKRIAIYQLHEELQQYIWTDTPILPAAYSDNISGTPLQFKFIEINQLIKGCVEWKNAKQISETHCLYAHSNK